MAPPDRPQPHGHGAEDSPLTMPPKLQVFALITAIGPAIGPPILIAGLRRATAPPGRNRRDRAHRRRTGQPVTGQKPRIHRQPPFIPTARGPPKLTSPVADQRPDDQQPDRTGKDDQQQKQQPQQVGAHIHPILPPLRPV